MDVEFVNHNAYAVQLVAPDKKTIIVGAKEKAVLPDWFMRYVPKHLRVVRLLGEQVEKQRYTLDYTKPVPIISNPSKPRGFKKPKRKSMRRVKSTRTRKSKRNIVGRALASRATADKYFREALPKIGDFSFSNNVGVGILSYNRLPCLQRVLASVRACSNPNRVTIFVSDESTDPKVMNWLEKQPDIVAFHSENRGIAENTNRLLACLARFQYKFILNDDIEITRAGWCDLYIKAHQKTGIHHFCFRQPGIYGAKIKDGEINSVRGAKISTIKEKPQGGMIFLTHEAFEKVGFFDSSFGQYGMEHVDYSRRISRSGLQLPGYHDVVGSENFIRLHKESSAVEDRVAKLAEARKRFGAVDNEKRVKVPLQHKINLPKLTYIIPCREPGDRGEAIRAVVRNVRAQRFPIIDIILVEQDNKKMIHTKDVQPIKHMLAKNYRKNQQFTKSHAFNLGVCSCEDEFIVLHDADMLVADHYSIAVHRALQNNDSCHLGKTVIYMTTGTSQKITKNGGIDASCTSNRVVGYFEGGSLACKRSKYINIGGFNEDFEGYGCEDCDFFRRMLKHTKCFNQRSFAFVHLAHGRATGWETYHEKNKKIQTTISRSMTDKQYMARLHKQLKAKYKV